MKATLSISSSSVNPSLHFQCVGIKAGVTVGTGCGPTMTIKVEKKGTGTQWDTGDMKTERWPQRVEGTVGQGHGKEGVEMGNQQKHLLLKDDIGKTQ